MDERHTLSLLAWTIGGIVGIMFLLNAVALSLVPQQSGLAARHAAPAGRPVIKAKTTLRLAATAQPARPGIE